LVRIPSFEHFGISPPRILGLGFAAAIGSYLVLAASLGEALGEATGPVAIVVALLAFYTVLSTPRRVLDRQRMSQARESVALSASAMACLSVTGSRSKTLMTLRPREQTLASATRQCARKILLGLPVDLAAAESANSLVSYSAADTFRVLASMDPDDFGEGDEESRGLSTSIELYRETKLPMFMTACFFSPIMLVLYAVFTHTYGSLGLLELATFEFVIVDLAFFFCSRG